MLQPHPIKQRNEGIYKLHASGMSFADIVRIHGISGEGRGKFLIRFAQSTGEY